MSGIRWTELGRLGLAMQVVCWATTHRKTKRASPERRCILVGAPLRLMCFPQRLPHVSKYLQMCLAQVHYAPMVMTMAMVKSPHPCLISCAMSTDNKQQTTNNLLRYHQFRTAIWILASLAGPLKTDKQILSLHHLSMFLCTQKKGISLCQVCAIHPIPV